MPALEFFKSLLEGSGRSRVLDDDGVRADPDGARDGQEHRPAHRADRARRGAHVRHGRHVPPGRHLFVGRPALHAAGRRPAHRTTARTRRARFSRKASTRAASYCSWIAAGTAYANHGVQMIPFYIYYSMFGFQRIGDFAWAGGDMQARGFLLGGTAGRTTLAGEGLQHQDGHSQLVATTIPNCRRLRPVLRLRARRHHPGRLAPHVRGAGERLLLHHRDERELRASGDAEGRRAGNPARHVPAADRAARARCACSSWAPARSCARCSRRPSCSRSEFGIPADVWSVTSFSELRRDALDVERWNALHPDDEPRTSYVAAVLRRTRSGPFVAATDYMKIVSDQIRQWVPGPLRRARHRRLRPQRLPRGAAPPLRSRPQLDRRRGAQGARRRRQHRSQHGRQGA